jgi:hypothetical protein
MGYHRVGSRASSRALKLHRRGCVGWEAGKGGKGDNVMRCSVDVRACGAVQYKNDTAILTGNIRRDRGGCWGFEGYSGYYSADNTDALDSTCT